MSIIGKFKDLTGQRFGRLTVIERAESKSKNNKIMWLCKCDCGNYHTTISHNLTSGLCKSCGCLHLSINWDEPLNRYDLSGDYGIGYTSDNQLFKFDLEDYDKIKNYTWFISSNGYVLSNQEFNGKQKRIRLHRLVMGINDNSIIVDHIYHDKSDNRKSQLRLVNKEQNSYNHLVSANNTSGETGVYWHKKYNKWQSLIGFNDKIIYLGMFNNKEDAIKARKEAEIKYFGEYRYID